MIVFIEDAGEKEDIAREILQQLPEWFGLPESTRTYVEESRELPFWACLEAEQPAGFLVLKETGLHTAEIYVMGILKEKHRSGIGRALLWESEAYARAHGYEFLQVKTVQKGHYEEYDRTNAFYERMGFRELECFPQLWDAWNPCQVYIKSLIQTQTLEDVGEEGYGCKSSD